MDRRHGRKRRLAILCAAAVAALAALVTITGCMECISPVIQSGERSIDDRNRRDRQFEDPESESEER